MTPADPPVIDAVFVDIPADPPKPPPADQRPPEGYGRRTVAGTGPRRVMEVIAGTLEDAAPVARLLGADDAAEMAEKGAAVAREAPRFVEAVVREGQPLRARVGDLLDAAKRKGWYQTRPPKPAAKAPRRPVGPQRKAKAKGDAS